MPMLHNRAAFAMTESSKNDDVPWSLLDIVRMDAGVYRARIISADGQIMESKCRVTIKEMTTGGGVGHAAFDSAEFESKFRSANISTEKIIQAIFGSSAGYAFE